MIHLSNDTNALLYVFLHFKQDERNLLKVRFDYERNCTGCLLILIFVLTKLYISFKKDDFKLALILYTEN